MTYSLSKGLRIHNYISENIEDKNLFYKVHKHKRKIKNKPRKATKDFFIKQKKSNILKAIKMLISLVT